MGSGITVPGSGPWTRDSGPSKKSKVGKSRKRSRERRYENLTTIFFNFYHTLAIFFCSDHGCKMLRANWRPLLLIFPDHVPIPGRQRANRENGHSDQQAEGDLQAGQLSVLLIPLFSLINYSTLDSRWSVARAFPPKCIMPLNLRVLGHRQK